MASEPLGCEGGVPEELRRNNFALVFYVPGALGEFLDDLRRELVPHYNPKAHVSVLPPRPLAGDWRTAGGLVGALAGESEAFSVELTTVEVFPVTDVIYLQVGRGSEELRHLHSAM